MGLKDFFKVKKSTSALTEHARSNPFFDVMIHKVDFPATGASTAEFYTINHKFFACSAVCLDHENRILLKHVPRFPLRDIPGDEYSWELPGGRNNSSETPLECIKRELKEEAGMVADKLELILKDYYYPESSFGTEKLYLFLVRSILKEVPTTPEREGEFESRWFKFDEAVKMIFNGEIRSSWTIIGILATKVLMGKMNAFQNDSC